MKRLHLSLILALCAFAGCGRPDAQPRQPFAFSHKTHAGTNHIDCQYCHGGVRTVAAAGIPSVQRCMGCHVLVAATRPDIVRLRSTFEQGESIRWMRMNEIPDFVFFRHQPHVARGFACRTCHGMVETMDEFQPPFPVASMSWCVGCHRTNGGSVDCTTCHR